MLVQHRIPIVAHARFAAAQSSDFIMALREDQDWSPLRCLLWVKKGGCGRSAGGAAGVPPASEIPPPVRDLRFVPTTEVVFDLIV